MTPESSTEIDLDVAVLVELAVKFTVPAVIENVPPRWLEVDPPAVTSGWSTLTSIPLTLTSTGSTVALLVEVAVPVTAPAPTEILPEDPDVGAFVPCGPM